MERELGKLGPRQGYVIESAEVMVSALQNGRAEMGNRRGETDGIVCPTVRRYAEVREERHNSIHRERCCDVVERVFHGGTMPPHIPGTSKEAAKPMDSVWRLVKSAEIIDDTYRKW